MTRRAFCRAYPYGLLGHEHPLYEALPVDTELVEVDARGYLVSSVHELPVPVRDVVTARQHYVGDLDSALRHVARPALQNRDRNQLR